MLLLAGASSSAGNSSIEPDGPAPAMEAAPPSVPAESPAAPPEPPASPPDRPADACLADTGCIDNYLWSLYQRTPKVDTVSVSEQTKVTVKRKGKSRTVTKTVTKVAGEDFAWKDPKAAELIGMEPKDYVIGGMDAGFRATLYVALHALDDAGFKPGITCAFRDDYRQSIATGLKAQNDRSFHGGSLRGGYGHGMAADIVSVRGETRMERLASSTAMWEYIDRHEKELGIGRPYRDRDPPHAGPLDGQEYADHRLKPTLQHAKAQPGKAETRKAVTGKAEAKKADAKKAETKKAETKKAETKKAETRKAETRKAETRKAETKKAETKKAETRKAEARKAASKKADTRKAEIRKPDNSRKAETRGPGDRDIARRTKVTNPARAPATLRKPI
jgi:hypothetical protein